MAGESMSFELLAAGDPTDVEGDQKKFNRRGFWR